MTLNSLPRIIVVALLFYSFVINNRKDDPKDVSMVLIVGAFGILSTELLVILNIFNPGVNITGGLNYFDYAIAIIALVSGVALNFFEKRQHHVFNLLGENNKKELIDNNYKVKNMSTGIVRERSIDFMELTKPRSVNEEINKLIKDIILREVNTINHYPNNNNIYLTSMASIPYTVLFGTYLEDKKPIKYLNYNRFESEYVLLPDKIKKKKHLKVSVESDLKERDLEETREVLVSISGTFPIHSEDIKDFEMKNKILISTNNSVENNITSQEEINNIANQIVNCLIEASKTKDVIHVVAAIPGMLSIELGRVINNRDNLLTQIIVYHYNAQAKPKYKYGIVVNGSKEKGKLIERR